jgi:hypothetical protein
MVAHSEQNNALAVRVTKRCYTGKNTLGLAKCFSCIGTAIQENNLYFGEGETFLTKPDPV